MMQVNDAKNIILHKVPNLIGVFQLFSSPVFVGVGVAELLGAGFSAQLQQCQTCARPVPDLEQAVPVPFPPLKRTHSNR